MPFSEFQLDTKHLLDKNTLPMEVYKYMKDYNLPQGGISKIRQDRFCEFLQKRMLNATSVKG
jgi:hypothetical protein